MTSKIAKRKINKNSHTFFFDTYYQNNSYMVIKSFNINRYDVRENSFPKHQKKHRSSISQTAFRQLN